MLDPVSLGLGALSFGSQAFGAISQYNSGVKAARDQNRQAMKIYEHQMRAQADDYVQRIGEYNLRKAQFQEQVLNNQTAAGRAYIGEQQRLNEIMKQMAFQRQDSNIERIKAEGKAIASGQSGASAARNLAMETASAGRAEAVREAQGARAKEMALYRAEGIRDQLRIANRQAYYNVGQAPRMGRFAPAPMQQSGPSQLGLFASLGQAALGGVNTYMNYANYQPQASKEVGTTASTFNLNNTFGMK